MAAVCPPQQAYYAPVPTYADMNGPPNGAYAPEGYHQPYAASQPIPANYAPPPSAGYGAPPTLVSYPVSPTPPDMPRAPFAQPNAVGNVPPRGASDVIDLLDELFAAPSINVNQPAAAPAVPQNHINFAPTQIAPSVSPVHGPSSSPVPPPTYDHGLAPQYAYNGQIPGHVTPPPPSQTYGYAAPPPVSVSPVPPEGQQWGTSMQPINPAPVYAPVTQYTQDVQQPQAWIQQGGTVPGGMNVDPQYQQPATTVSPVPPPPQAPQAAHPGYPISPPWQQPVAAAPAVEVHQSPPPPYAVWGSPAEHQQPNYSVPAHTYGAPHDAQQMPYPAYQASPVSSVSPVPITSPASSETYNMDETAAQLKATEDRIAELKRQIAERAARAAGQPQAPAGGFNANSHLASDEEFARRLQEEENGRGGSAPPVMDAAALRRQQELEDEAFARQLEQQERGGGTSQPPVAQSTIRRVHFAGATEQQTLDDEALARQLQAEEERAVSLRNSFAMNRPTPVPPPPANPGVPEWVPDALADACMNDRCAVKFRALGAHRHHCRNCGLVFCDNCSKYRRRTAQGRDERVCYQCMFAVNR